MTRRLRIGLTGGIASGKTTVAERFAEHGILIVDADAAARAVVAPGTPGLAKVTDTFGPRVLLANGELDRRAMRDMVFADPAKRIALEAILHPLIRAQMEREAAAATSPYLIMAIPLLVEGGGRGRVDRVLVVDVPEATQLARLEARDGGTPDQARAILASQASREGRLQAADDVLTNVGSVPELRHSVDVLHERYLRLARTTFARDEI